MHAKGNDSNPLKKFIVEKREIMDSYWKAVCAAARKLLVMIWHVLKKNLTWKNPRLTEELKKKIQSVILRKIKLFENKTQKYQKAWEKLSGQSDEVLEIASCMRQDPRMLLKVLVNSV